MGEPADSPGAGARDSETQTVHDPTDGAVPEGGSGTGPEGALGRGAFVGRYLVLALLGRGGMGEVYTAYDPELDRKVALKVLRADRPGPGRRAEAQARLLREAQAAARLSHPNLVTVHDVGAVGERVFLTLELIDGVDLGSWLAARPRAVREVLAVFRDAGEGILAVHRAGLVHGDFKPSNVMVADDGRVVVLDFGLAHAPHSGEAGGAASSPTPGTPGYMAPEQIGGGPVDPRADQFAFCVALYQALSGELPFAGDSPAELRQAIEAGRLREPPAGAAVPGWLRRALLRGLAADPAARFPGMDELLTALAADPARQRRRWLAAAALTALVAAGGALAWSLFAPRTPLLCRDADRKLAGLWDAGRQEKIRRALAGSGTWGRVRPLLDGYARDWIDLHTRACEATHLRGEQSEHLLDLQMACLEARRQELGAATDLLARGDRQAVRNAVTIARGLTGLAGCRDARGLLAVTPPADDPGVRARIAQVRAELARGGVLELAAKYPDALALLEKANREADALGYSPLLAEARWHLALTLGRTGRLPAMRAALLDAVDRAQASHSDEMLAHALTALVLAATMAGDMEESRLWERLSASALERLGTNPEVAADRHFYLGLRAIKEGPAERAVEHLRAFLALEPAGRSRQSVHAALLNLGMAYGELHRFAEAKQCFDRSLAEGLTTYGPDHPGVAATLCSLGKFHQLQDQPALAIDYYGRCLGVYDRVRWPGRERAYARNGLGETLIDAGRPAEAVPLLEQAVAERRGSPEDPAFLAQSKFQLARALWRSGGDRGQARRLALEARGTFHSLGERGRDKLARVDAWLARPAEAR